MRRATVTETKNQLSKLLDLVRKGESVLIVDRGRPVARLVPEHMAGGASEDRLARLERAGTIVRGQRRARRLTPPPRPPAGVSVLAALQAERAEER